MAGYVPDRSDIILTDFDPTRGHEQALKRPALVLTPQSFNRLVGLALVAPVTSRIRGHAFEVSLAETRTAGVVLCHQIRMIDYRARGAHKLERAPPAIVEEVLARVRTLVS
jgi:mRNA interferase MazF